MIPAENSPYPTSLASNAGKEGKTNEDRSLTQGFFLDEAQKIPAVFAIVADGIGASRAGQVAAGLAVEAISKLVAHSDASQPTGILQAAFIQASRLILQRSEGQLEWKGMGSTCLCAWVIGDRMYAACVGNSHLYLMHGNRLILLNVPHTLPSEQADAPESGRKSKFEEPQHGYLGAKTPVDADLKLQPVSGPLGKASTKNQGLRLRPNDRLLLCSDDLAQGLETSEIGEVLASSPIEMAAQDLVQLGLERGILKNITAIVIGVPPSIAPLAPRHFVWLRAFARVASLLALIGLALLAWVASRDRLQPPGQPTATAIFTLTPFPTNTPLQ